MKKYILPTLLTTCCLVGISASVAWSEEDPIAQEEAAAGNTKDRPEWNDNLKSTYNLTDEQITALKAKGMNYPQIAISAQLAQKSGKTIDEVVKMRLDDKMGWGKIAKDLGVPPSEIGHSVRDMRHKMRDQKMMAKEERRAEKAEKRAAKQAEKAAAKGEKHEGKGH